MRSTTTIIDEPDGTERANPPIEIGDRKPENGNKEPDGGIPRITPVAFDAGTFDAGTNSGEPPARKRRGRPPGTRNANATSTAAETKASTPDLSDLKALLLSVHFMGAQLLSAPELEIDADEAKKLSEAIQNVAKYYPMVFDPKKMAIIQLAFVASGIYGTRAIAIYKRKQAEPHEETPLKNAPTPINKPKAPPAGVPLTNPSQLFGDGGGAGGDYDRINLGF